MFIVALFTKSQKVKTTQVIINRCIPKQDVIYKYSKILFSLKKERKSDIWMVKGTDFSAEYETS